MNKDAKRSRIFFIKSSEQCSLNLVNSVRLAKSTKKFLHLVNQSKALFTQAEVMSTLSNHKLAVIDCGTNTFNLLIVELQKDHTFKKIYSTRVPVKLGEGAINQGYIAAVPFLRGLSALESFEKEIRFYGVNQVKAIATSAIRDAKNGAEFVALAMEKYAIPIEVIDGDREAALIAKGVMAAVKSREHKALIMDIGGGSTEFIIVEKDKVLWKQSFGLGVARLLERFKPSDPISREEVEAIFDYLDIRLQPLLMVHNSLPCLELIGSSGAFDSLVEILHHEQQGEALTEEKTEYSIQTELYCKLSGRLRASTLEQRKHIRGLVAMRVDMIVMSCLLIDYVLQKFNLKLLTVSTFSLKEGALVEAISNKSPNFKPN